MMASRAVFVVIVIGGVSVGIGCGGGSGAVTVNKIVPQSTSQQQNVMVIDHPDRQVDRHRERHPGWWTVVQR